jgi:hypothetical protein
MELMTQPTLLNWKRKSLPMLHSTILLSTNGSVILTLNGKLDNITKPDSMVQDMLIKFLI